MSTDNDIPYVATLLETRTQVGTLLDSMTAGAGPLILGNRGAPAGVLVTFDLFDELRDRLGYYDALGQLPQAASRATHPAGPATSPLSALLGGDDPTPVTYWPELVGDLRSGVSADLVDALGAIARGRLPGTQLQTDPWRWFLVVTTPAGQPARGWHVIWRDTGSTIELVAAAPVSDLLTRAWQAGPVPNPVRTHQDD